MQNDFMKNVTLQRPRFAAEERIGTLVLKACGISGKGIDILRERYVVSSPVAGGLDRNAMKGRWPITRCILAGAASERFGLPMEVHALPEDDPAINQVLAGNTQSDVSNMVIVDSGRAMLELRVARHRLAVFEPPYSVKDGMTASCLRIIQPVEAMVRTIDLPGWLEREMLL